MSDLPGRVGATRRAIFEWVGVVSRRPDPYVARMTWLALIADHRLRPIESFATPNPFTGGAVEVCRPGCEPAAFPRRGRRLGVVVWCPEAKGVSLYGDPAAMMALGRKIAADIGGTYGPPGDA